jgi:hypothetical protein
VLRVVLDPGVLVSTIISAGGTPATLLLASAEGAFDFIASPMLLSQLEEVLRRSKFRPHIALEDVPVFMERFRELATAVPDPEEVPSVSRDPKDDYLVALAVDAGANALVSGDADLTSIADPPLPIMTPREFLELLRRTGAIG